VLQKFPVALKKRTGKDFMSAPLFGSATSAGKSYPGTLNHIRAFQQAHHGHQPQHTPSASAYPWSNDEGETIVTSPRDALVDAAPDWFLKPWRPLAAVGCLSCLLVFMVGLFLGVMVGFCVENEKRPLALDRKIDYLLDEWKAKRVCLAETAPAVLASRHTDMAGAISTAQYTPPALSTALTTDNSTPRSDRHSSITIQTGDLRELQTTLAALLHKST
jgi:hypothetical protein